ncbi:hypothetical protein G9A89_003291 [Geosiphon pyriformis]|nr:hypothetical protein G9A89_003291 [Geosiphon pyriformis]
MELVIPLISPAVQIIGDNLKINSVIGSSTTSWKREFTAKQALTTFKKKDQKPLTTSKHLQTPEQGTSIKLPLSITLFLISLVQPKTPSLLLNHFSRPEDFQSFRNLTQQQEPISTSANIIDYLQENESNHSESLENEETESEPEEITGNKKEMATAYITKIPEFTSEDNDISPQKWLDQVQKAGDANTGLKDKLIKKVCPHIPTDLATAIRHVKNYEMAMEEANHTKFVNLAIGKTTTSQTNNNSNNNHKDINSHNDTTKTILDHHPTTNLKIVIIVEFQDTGNKIVGNYKETNKTGVINITLYHNNLITNLHYQPIIHQDHKIKTVTINQLHNQYSNNISNLYQFGHIRHHPLNNIKYQQEDWFNITNSHPKINFRITTTELIQITNEVAAPRSNSFNNTILPAQIAQNANLSDIFSFEFEANELPSLLSNAAVNKQRAITAMYTKATVEKKPIRLILNSRSAGNIIIYQLMQQLQRTVNRPAQTVIVIADGMKKTPVEEIDNFLFTIDKITISIKVLVIDAPQYQALVENDWLFKANANLNWETQKLKISYQGQYIIVPATCGTFNKQSEKAPVFEFEEEKEMPLTETYMALGSTSNWAKETEQEIFEESRGWKKEHVFFQKRNMKLIPVTFAKHAIENDLDLQKEVENGTTLLASHVEIHYQKNVTELILQ